MRFLIHSWNCLWLKPKSTLFSCNHPVLKPRQNQVEIFSQWSLQVIYMGKSIYFTLCSTLEHSSDNETEQTHRNRSRSLKQYFLSFQHITQVCYFSSFWMTRLILLKFYVIQLCHKINHFYMDTWTSCNWQKKQKRHSRQRYIFKRMNFIKGQMTFIVFCHPE